VLVHLIELFDFSRTLPWQPIKVEKSAFFAVQYFVALPFQNRLQCRNLDFKTLGAYMNFSKLCTILVIFGPETLEFTLLTIAFLWQYGKNRHITLNISE